MTTNTKRFRIKPKPAVRKPAPKINYVLYLEGIHRPNHHRSIYSRQLLGPATPANFKKAVAIAFNKASASGDGQVLYLALLRAGRKAEKIAKLFQAKRNQLSPNSFAMFSTFSAPDGERLKRQAKIPAFFERRRGAAYPSRPVNN